MSMALIGGVIIGLAVSLMLYWNGRVTGISGIVNGLLAPMKGDISWRISFILGLLFGGFLLHFFRPELFTSNLNTSKELTILAGLLVGFGTVMGGGCTSGHGVCGVSRLSPRSIIATCVFMAAGITTVLILRKWEFLP